MEEKTPILGTMMKIIACTPNKNFNDEEYLNKVIEPTKQLRKLYEDLGNKEPNLEQIAWAYKVLKEILVAKQVEKQESNERLEELIKEYNLSEVVDLGAT